MADQEFIIEGQKISAVSTLEEVAEMTGMLLDEGEISRTDFQCPRIYRIVRAVDRLVRGELEDQTKQDAIVVGGTRQEGA